MKVLAIIPARGGSKGVVRKNIKLLAGKPLIVYTIESAVVSKKLSKIIVSTDDREIMSVSQQAGAEVPFLRPDFLAQDDTPTLPVIQHALNYCLDKGDIFDAVCLLQPTTPFRMKGFIDEAVSRFENSGADSLISVIPVPTDYNPHWVFESTENGFLKIATGDPHIITRRQLLPHAYIRDGAIYITKTDVILKENSLYGAKISFIENSTDNHVNIDTLDDWEVAQKLASVFVP